MSPLGQKPTLKAISAITDSTRMGSKTASRHVRYSLSKLTFIGAVCTSAKCQ